MLKQFGLRWQSASALALLTMFVLAGGAVAGSKRSNGNEAALDIDNFGQMDERFFRGAQPHESDYPGLAALGIKTIIDLTDKPTSYEKRSAEAANPQSAPAMTFSLPTSFAKRTIRSATSSGCSTRFVV